MSVREYKDIKFDIVEVRNDDIDFYFLSKHDVHWKPKF